jgi:hypothetical protein
MRRAPGFTGGDVTRILKGARAAGEKVRRMEFGKDRIIVDFGEPEEDGEARDAPAEDHTWDK